MKVSQSELDSSKAWKAYKALVEKAEASKTVAELKKLDAGSDAKYDRVREFFGGNKQLGSDLSNLCSNTISSRIHMFTPRRARLPKPDYEGSVKGGYKALDRDVRIVEEFRKAQLKDDFIESLRKDLLRSVSALRHNIETLEKERVKRPPKDPIKNESSIDSMNSALQTISAKVDGWELDSRRSVGKSDSGFLLQSELDTSTVWKSYCGIHRQIQAAKSADSLAGVPKQANLLKIELANLFKNSGFADTLEAWVKMGCESKTFELANPKRVRGTAEDWARLLSEYELIQVEFQIAGYFKTRSLGHSLIWTMTTSLTPRSQNLANNAKSFRSNAGYKGAAPGTWKKLTAKQEKDIQEIEAFEKSTQRTLVKWKKARN